MAVRTSLLSSVAMFLFILPLLLLAADVRHIVPSNVESELFVEYTAIVGQSTSEMLPWPSFLLILFAIGLLGAFLSTADTSAMLIATVIGNERRRHLPQSAVEPREVIIIVWATVGIGAILAIVTTDAATAFTGVLGILAAQGIPFLFAIYWRVHKIVVPVVLFLGAAVALAQTFVLPEQYSEGYYILIPAIPGLACIFFLRRIKEKKS